MLKKLTIQNFALITELEIDFSPGLNILTGETGAGKSIIFDALSAVLGGKADVSFVRDGEARASIEAVFETTSICESLNEYLDNEDLLNDPDDLSNPENNILTLTREIRAGGRSSARVNGRSVSQAILREIGAFLVDIHGQSDQLSLLNPASHLALIDRFAGHGADVEAYRALLKRYRSIRSELDSLERNDAEKERRRDFIAFQLEEIDNAKLSVGEEEPLRQERDRIGNSEALSRLVGKCLDTLEWRSERQPGVVDELNYLQSQIEKIVRLDPTRASLEEQILDLIDGAAGLYEEIRDYQDEIEYDPNRLEFIENRLQLIHDMERKYGGSVERVLAFAESIRAELDTIEGAADRIVTLTKEERALKSELAERAGKLSARRKDVSAQIAARVEAELADLSMRSATFEICLTQSESDDGLLMSDGRTLEFTANGVDRAEFLIAPNRGEGTKPLAKIASGGETSRLMLALKNTLADADEISTMIFDEIDQGISGRVGAAVGEKLWRLSRNHQVICVTHLPQLAAYYDTHYSVSKTVLDNRTETVVTRLSPEQSETEIAMIIGGANAENLSAAKVMIAEAENRKRSQ